MRACEEKKVIYNDHDPHVNKCLEEIRLPVALDTRKTFNGKRSNKEPITVGKNANIPDCRIHFKQRCINKKNKAIHRKYYKM